MASLKTHELDCSLLLGLPYKKVHKWLDAYASSFPPPLFGEYHRSFRHNDRGVHLCQEYFGGESALAAKIHLVRDNERYLLTATPFDCFSLDDIRKWYKVLTPFLNDPRGMDCPIPPSFINNYHNETNMSWSAIMDVYNIDKERKV